MYRVQQWQALFGLMCLSSGSTGRTPVHVLEGLLVIKLIVKHTSLVCEIGPVLAVFARRQHDHIFIIMEMVNSIPHFATNAGQVALALESDQILTMNGV